MHVGDNTDMTARYAPQRRELLALENQIALSANSSAQDAAELTAGQNRQLALSVPESMRALGEPLDPFFEACGGPTSIALAVRRADSDDPPETHIFRQPFVVIGACRECDLPLTESNVAFRHFYLQLIGGRWFVVDLWGLTRSSAAERGGCSGWFNPGAEIGVGSYIITHVPGAASTAVEDTSSRAMILDSRGDRPVAELELLNGHSNSGSEDHRRLTSAVTLIGSNRQCDLWLRDKSVSKVHASLVLTTEGLWMVDLLGRDGVLVDGRPAYWKQIHDAMELTIGRFKLRVNLSGRQQRSLIRAGSRQLAKKKRKQTDVGLTEKSVLRILQHLADMQSQFFEHSQLQMQLMTRMLDQLERTQQSTVRNDLSRIEQITRELQEIQSELKRSPAAPAVEPATAPASGAAGPAASATPPAAQPAARHATPVTPPPRAPEPPPPPAEPAVPVTASDLANSAEAHERLTRRMAKLAQERNKRWRRVLQAFSGKPAG